MNSVYHAGENPTLDDISPSLNFQVADESDRLFAVPLTSGTRNVFDTFSTKLPPTPEINCKSDTTTYSENPASRTDIGAPTQLSADADPSDIVDHFINNGLLTSSLSEFTSASQVSSYLMRTSDPETNTPSPVATSISWPGSGSHSDTPPTPDIDTDKKIQADCICKECGKSFNSVWYLKQHAVKHSSERPFKCKFCHKTYRFRSNLYQHKCPDRDKHMINRGAHGRGSRNVNAKRKLSTASSSSVNSLTSPMTESPLDSEMSVSFSCPPRQPKNHQGLKKSPLRPGSRSRSRGAVSPSFNSSTVSAKIPVHLSPTQGMSLITDGIGVLMGKSNDGDQNSDNTDPTSREASNVTPTRSASSIEPPELNKEQIEEYITRFRGRLHQCTKCRVWFPSREYLTRHMTSHTFVDSRVKCLHCSESFESESEYAIHKQRHAPQSLHVCPVCRGNFRSRLALKRHLAECSEVSPMKTASPDRPLSFVDRSPPHYPSFYEMEDALSGTQVLPNKINLGSSQSKGSDSICKETDSGIEVSDSPSSGGSDSSSYGTPPGGCFLASYQSGSHAGIPRNLRKSFESTALRPRPEANLEDESIEVDYQGDQECPISTSTCTPYRHEDIKRIRQTLKKTTSKSSNIINKKCEPAPVETNILSIRNKPLHSLQFDSQLSNQKKNAEDLMKELGSLLHQIPESRCPAAIENMNEASTSSTTSSNATIDSPSYRCQKCQVAFNNHDKWISHFCEEK